MTNRKYARFGEKPVRYECTNKKCKWQGTIDEKEKVKRNEGYTDYVCPKCMNDEFYGLIK